MKSGLRALFEQDAKALRAKVESGASVSQPDEGGLLPLERAAVYGDPETFQLFLGLGADPDAVDRQGNTALISAVKVGACEIVSMLVAAGADVNRRENKWTLRTPLMLAVRERDFPMVQCLMELGADTSLIDSCGETALICSANFERTEVWELLRTCTPPARTLAEAVLGCDLEGVQRHLAAGADPNVTDDWGWPILHRAIPRNPDPAVITALVEGGADVNLMSKSEEQFPPLHLAVLPQLLDHMSLLVRLGAALDARDGGGQTALSRSVGWNRRKAHAHLVALGAEISPDDAWFYAAQSGDIATVRRMLDQGNDITRTRELWSPEHHGDALAIAAMFGHADVVTLLVARGATRLDDAAWRARLGGHVELGDWLESTQHPFSPPRPKPTDDGGCWF